MVPAEGERIVAANYSMQGFSLSVADGIIELHSDGELGSGSEQAPARAFSTIAEQIDSRLILNDVRSAVLTLSEMEWAERMRFVARTFQGYRVAYVIRPDQAERAGGFVEAHARLGDTAACFRSKARARAWLKEE